MNIIDCRPYLKEIKEEMIKEVEKIKSIRGYEPSLVIIQVGDRPDSNKYIKNKMKHVTDCGARAELVKLPEDVTTEILLETIITFNHSSYDAIIVQEPLPPHINNLDVTNMIDPEKDLDCLTPYNMGLLLKGEPYVEPCTPRGIIEILDRNNIELEGRNILVIGRSEIVGKPLQIILTQRNATVTLAHSKSDQIDSNGYIPNSCEYDIIISAIGKAEFVKPLLPEEGTIFIDVGINFNEEGKMVGDIHIDKLLDKHIDGNITPVPFGVGTMTCGMVVKNLIDLAKKQSGIE